MNIVEYAKMRKMFGGGSGGDIDALIDGSLTEITSNAESVRGYAFNGCKSLTKAIFPRANTALTNTFDGCSSLVSVSFHLLKTIPYGFCYNCKSLANINLPSVTTISNNAFMGCERLEIVYLPSATSVSSWCFANNYSLKILDLPSVTTIASMGMRYCHRLTRLILRSETMCSLASKDAFDRCYHFDGTVDSTYNPDGLKDGYIYVPRALIDSYKTATNWVTFADQFRALEDYTVDGTTTGELDESKI